MLETDPLVGTFRVALITVGDVFDFYEVTGVRFKFQRTTGEVVQITGSGTYAVSTIADLSGWSSPRGGNEPPTVYRSDDVREGPLPQDRAADLDQRRFLPRHGDRRARQAGSPAVRRAR
jgi:hypothetical protein